MPTPTRFVEDVRALGGDPDRAGIMPFNFSQLRVFRLWRGNPALDAAPDAGLGDDVDSIRAFGADVVAALCQRLLEGGAPALRFYTLNLRARRWRCWIARLSRAAC